MTTIIGTTLDDELSERSGMVAYDRVNSLRIRKQVLIDIAKGVSNDPHHDVTRAFFDGVEWIEQIASVDSLGDALELLDDGISANALGAVHVVLGGEDDQLRFRVNGGEAVGIYEMPVQLSALPSRILPPDMMPVYQRKAPSALSKETPIMIHGCTNGEHDGLITSLWYAFGCEAPLLMPCCELSYELDGPTVRMTTAAAPDSGQLFRRIDRNRVGGAF